MPQVPKPEVKTGPASTSSPSKATVPKTDVDAFFTSIEEPPNQQNQAVQGNAYVLFLNTTVIMSLSANLDHSASSVSSTLSLPNWLPCRLALHRLSLARMEHHLSSMRNRQASRVFHQRIPSQSSLRQRDSLELAFSHNLRSFLLHPTSDCRHLLGQLPRRRTLVEDCNLYNLRRLVPTLSDKASCLPKQRACPS